MPAPQKAQQDKSKFSANELHTKSRIKEIRIAQGFDMAEGAKRMEISRKQLEDIETPRNYGCHITLDILVKASEALKVPVQTFVTPLFSGEPR